MLTSTESWKLVHVPTSPLSSVGAGAGGSAAVFLHDRDLIRLPTTSSGRPLACQQRARKADQKGDGPRISLPLPG